MSKNITTIILPANRISQKEKGRASLNSLLILQLQLLSQSFYQRCYLGGDGLLGAAAGLAVELALELLLVLLVSLLVPRVTILQGGILAREIVTLVAGANVVSAAGREVARTGGKLGGDGGVGGNPAGQCIFAVLDDGLAGLVAVIGGASLTRSDRAIVNELEEVLSIASNDGDLLAMLAESVELVRVGSLDLLASNVGKLGLSDQRLSLSADKLLLEDNNLGRVRLLVLQVGDLVGDALLAVTAGLNRGLDVANALHGDAVLVVAVDVLVLELTNLVQQDTELVGDIRDVLIGTLTPDGELLGDIHALLGNGLETAHNVLLHLDELGELLGQVRAKGATSVAAESMACMVTISESSI